jgi:hypothetical protein
MPVPDIIDNAEYQLFEVLNNLLGVRDTADFASGFFNIGGYAMIKKQVISLR